MSAENLVSGTMVKSKENSFFLNFHHTSTFAERIFHENPIYKERQIDVIQVMLIEKGYVLVECVFK